MRKLITALIIVSSGIFVSAQGQSSRATVIPLYEAPIFKIGDVPLPPDPNLVPCGDYFVFRTEKDPTVAPLVGFAVMYAVEKMTILHTIEPVRIEVHVWSGERVPKALIHIESAPRLPWFEVNLSKKDFEGSPCLKLAKLKYHA
jgi:hypothetical protein